MARKGLNIYKRRDGRWEGRYRSGFTPDGKARYSSIYGKSYSTVREQIEKKRAEYNSGAECSCKSTVGKIIEMWLDDVKNKVKASALANYEMKLKAALTSDPTCSNVGILLSAATGIRIGELCALKRENIDLEKRILTVRQTVQRVMIKGGGTRLMVRSPKSASSEREILLPDFILPYLKNIKADGGCYLLSDSNKIVKPRAMQLPFQECSEMPCVICLQQAVLPSDLM